MIHELVPVSDCVQAFAIYASFDGNSPDSADLVLCASHELAKEISLIIADKYDGICFAEGFDFCKSWEIRETVARRESVLCSLSDFEAVAEAWGCEED